MNKGISQGVFPGSADHQKGSFINQLRLSLKRQQYQQLVETIYNAFKVPSDLIRPPTDTTKFPTIDEHNKTIKETLIDTTKQITGLTEEVQQINSIIDAICFTLIFFFIPVILFNKSALFENH
jgi:phosphoribosylaminoimidazole-succinocarboxamide synthase